MVDQMKRSKLDIFGWPLIGPLFKNPKIVLFIRIAVLALFLSAVYFGLLYTSKAENPYTTAVFWSLFWPFFMIVSLILLGPAFCGICPHGFIGKYITKFGLKKEMPQWLKKRTNGLIVLIILYWIPLYLFPGILKTPWIASLLFLVLTLFAMAGYYLYKEMSYCTYLCPIGAVTKAYGKMGAVQLRTYQSECVTCKTFECASVCDTKLQPFLFEKRNSMRDCTLCMDCANACEAVSFSVTKPSQTLFEKINDRHHDFTWVYILLLAIITITMRFHHGLGHSSIKDTLPWTHTGIWLQSFMPASVDWVGFSALSMALFMTFFLVGVGFKLASSVLNVPFKSFLHDNIYALAPLMIIGSLSHVGTFFFIHYASDISNAFYWLIGSAQSMKPLASMREGWVHIFSLLGYVGVIWSGLILYKRIAMYQKPFLARVSAWLLGSMMLWFYLFLLVLQMMVMRH